MKRGDTILGEKAPASLSGPPSSVADTGQSPEERVLKIHGKHLSYRLCYISRVLRITKKRQRLFFFFFLDFRV